MICLKKYSQWRYLFVNLKTRKKIDKKSDLNIFCLNSENAMMMKLEKHFSQTASHRSVVIDNKRYEIFI